MKKRNEHKKTNRRGNVKVYFQRWMMLMAAIMVTTALVGCGETNGGDGDQKLVGLWTYWYGGTTNSTNRYYTFNKDGSFSYEYHASGSSGFFIKGKYTASNNKIYFKDFVYEGIAELTISEAVYEYEIGSDEKGVYLKMAGIRFNEPYVDISWAVIFRKD